MHFDMDVCIRTGWIASWRGICTQPRQWRAGTHTDAQWSLDYLAISFPAIFQEKAAIIDNSSSSSTYGVAAEAVAKSADRQVANVGHVHLGFLACWLANHQRMQDAVDTILHSDYMQQRCAGRAPAVLVCGHSLGSGCAMAGMLAFAKHLSSTCSKMQHEENAKPAQISSVLFGAPRAGTREYVDELVKQDNVQGRLWRIVHENDLITHMPPAQLCGYRHVHMPWLHLRRDSRKACWKAPVRISFFRAAANFALQCLRNLFNARLGGMGARVGAVRADHSFLKHYFQRMQDYLGDGARRASA